MTDATILQSLHAAAEGQTAEDYIVFVPDERFIVENAPSFRSASETVLAHIGEYLNQILYHGDRLTGQVREVGPDDCPVLIHKVRRRSDGAVRIFEFCTRHDWDAIGP